MDDKKSYLLCLKGLDRWEEDERFSNFYEDLKSGNEDLTGDAYVVSSHHNLSEC
jgi:hypothetical protein